MPQMSYVLRERAIVMLTAGMSTRAVARELNVHFSTISRLQRHFREFGSTSNRPHTRRPRVTTPVQDLHIQHLATIGLHNQRISAQTARNRLREAHLHARRPHLGFDLTTVRCRNRLTVVMQQSCWNNDCFQTGFWNTQTISHWLDKTESPAPVTCHWLSCCYVRLAGIIKWI